MRARILNKLVSLMIAVLPLNTAPVRAAWNTQIYAPHVEAALLDTADLRESSGLAASRTNPGIYWTHNDSGGTPHVWAVRLNTADMVAHVAKKMGSAYLPSASNVDWEDISAGPGSYIYVFDGGDNPPCDRTNKRIHRFSEPTIDLNGSVFTVTPAFDSIRFEYPDTANPTLPADSNDERYDCETLMVHPISGDIYLITKRTNTNIGTARVYKLPASAITWNTSTIHVLQYVADMSTWVSATPTGGDIDKFGVRLLIRNYGTAYEYTLPEGQPFDAIFSQSPRKLSLSGELQGESICFATEGGDIITTSEVVSIGPQTCPFYIIPWQLANAQAINIKPGRASIRWDTAAPAGSTVNYGNTTSYGSMVNDPLPFTAHELLLTSLLPNTQYYFQVSSSATLTYPQSPEATKASFTTPAAQPGDFDLDGDVDQTDLDSFMTCASGPEIPHIDTPICQQADFDKDLDVDADDFATLQRSWDSNP